MRALLVCQAFPPLLKNAGGVSKRYLTLCAALIDELGWKVTLVTPVNVLRSGDRDVERWLREGSLVHIPARGVRANTADGIGVFLDLFSWVNSFWLLHCLFQHAGYDVCIADDVPWRFQLQLLMRCFNVPTIVTSHTDATRLQSSKAATFRFVWRVHMWSARLAEVHASVSKVFAKILHERENTPVNAIWPPILWSTEFRAERGAYANEAAALRGEWVGEVERKDGFTPIAVFMFAGRWANEKRIHLLIDAVPAGCALVIVGDGTSVYADEIAATEKKGVLPRRAMLNAHQLRVAYQACDVFVSASDFETLGNTVVESLCSGTPVAVQPAQGHLEHIVDGENSYFVDFDDAEGARRKLARIVGSGGDGGEGMGHPQGFPGALPSFLDTGRRFRESDFAKECVEWWGWWGCCIVEYGCCYVVVLLCLSLLPNPYIPHSPLPRYEQNVLRPALRIAKSRRGPWRKGLKEFFIRPLIFVLWLVRLSSAYSKSQSL